MKKIIILSFLFFLIQLSAYSQTVNDIPIKDINTEYVQIIGMPGKVFSNKIQIVIDFGQKQSTAFDRKNIIRDSDGKKLDFNSMIDALNFLNDNGYECKVYGWCLVV